MATDFSSIFSCTVGGSDFQLVDYTWQESAIVANGRLQGRRIVVKGQGWIQASTYVGQSLGLFKARGSFRTSGQNLTITGPGGVIVEQLLAANCVDGGPHFDFEIEGGLQDGFGARHVNFTANAQTSPDPDSGTSQTTTQRTVTTSSDSLKGYTWSGTLTGPDVQKQFDDLLKSFQDAYPLPSFVVSHEFTRNEAGDQGTFRLSAVQMVDDLPEAPGDVAAVDGSASFLRSRDDQMRLTRTYTYDLVVVGDVDAVLDVIRPEGLILSESVEVGQYRRRTLRATFVTLEGGNGNALMNWQASFRYEPPDLTYEPRSYAGTTPVLIQRPLGVGRVTFSGSAVGAGVFIPEPGRPTGLKLLEPPQFGRTRINDVEFRTDWQYVWAYEADKIDLMLKMLLRPATEDLPKSPLPQSKQKHPPLPGDPGV